VGLEELPLEEDGRARDCLDVAWPPQDRAENLLELLLLQTLLPHLIVHYRVQTVFIILVQFRFLSLCDELLLFFEHFKFLRK